MPPVVKTIDEILKDLNAEEKGIWLELPTYFGLVGIEVQGPTINFLGAKTGLVLKAFFNTATSEIRLFVAKNLDVPDRDKLYGSN